MMSTNLTKEEQIMQMIYSNRTAWHKFEELCHEHSHKAVALVNGMKVTINKKVCSFYPSTGSWIIQKGNTVIKKGKGGYDVYHAEVENLLTSKGTPEQTQGKQLVINVPDGVTSITIQFEKSHENKN